MGRIYTGKGDSGTTNIHGGEVVPKDCPRIEANGTLDELNSLIGVIRAFNNNDLNPDSQLDEFLQSIQSALMPMMSLVATPSTRRDANPCTFNAGLIKECETLVDTLQKELQERKYFVHPGGTIVASLLQMARTVARRAERRLWTLHREDPLPEDITTFINRLSDAFFVLGRYHNQRNGCAEEKWQEFHYYRKKDND